MTCDGIVSNAGFELGSEAIYLGKKILFKPLHGQFEQLSNAEAIRDLNYGTVVDKLEPATMKQWLRHGSESHGRIRYPNVAKAVAKWIHNGQPGSLETLSRTLWSRAGLNPGYS